MKTTKVLQTNVTETNIDQVSKILNTSTKNRIAICNANTLVRSVRDLEIRNVINNFTIKTPDGFPVAKALSFLFPLPIQKLLLHQQSLLVCLFHYKECL